MYVRRTRTLTPDDLMRTVQIRSEDHTVVQAINRQIAHYANHIGQIVYLAKHFKSSEWQSLSGGEEQVGGVQGGATQSRYASS